MTSRNETAALGVIQSLRGAAGALEDRVPVFFPMAHHHSASSFPPSKTKAQRQTTLLSYSLEHWHGCILELVACLTPGNYYRCHSPAEQGENDETLLEPALSGVRHSWRPHD